MIMLFNILTAILNILAEPWWVGINALALIFTLVFIALYTKWTKFLVEATREMATVNQNSTKLHREEVELRKRPVVSFRCADETDFYFRTAITNFGMVHAKIRVKATIEINGIKLELPPGTHYTGERTWQVQAGGSYAPTFFGHLSFRKLFEFNKMPAPNPAKIKATVNVETWVVNFEEDELAFDDSECMNPKLRWDWDSKLERWIPEISPV